MAKNVDLKQFLLHKGERLAMGIALAAMILLLGLGGWSGYSSASPEKTASDIKNKAKRILDEIRAGAPESPPDIDPLLLEPLRNDMVNALAFATATPNFIETGLEDDKRMPPTVLAPVEFDKGVYRVQVMNYYINMAGDNKIRVGVLVPKDKDKKDEKVDVAKYMTARYGQNVNPAIIAYYQKMYDQQQAQQKQYKAMMEQMMRQSQPQGAEFTARPEWTLDFYEAGKVPNGAKMATTVEPYRMAVVSATFPYEDQLKEFIRALKLRGGLLELFGSKEDLAPRFTKIVVRRRALDALNGKEVEKWTEIDPEKDILPVLGQAVSFSPLEPGEEDLRQVVFPGLVLARPKLARGEYPRPNLPNLFAAVKVFNDDMLKKSDKGAVMVATPERRFSGEGIDAFGLGASVDDHGKGPGPGPKPAGKDGPKGGGDDKEQIVVPKYCLVRFCDVKVLPGRIYEYQLKIRLANPNFGKDEKKLAYPDLAKIKEIGGTPADEWAPKEPIRVSLSTESFYYATELDAQTLEDKYRRDTTGRLRGDKDVTFVQMHRWLEKVRLNPENAASLYPVGEWTVADVPVRRGEYIGRMEQVKLPVWFPTRDRGDGPGCFDFAVPISTAATRPTIIGAKPTPGAKGIPVTFSTDDLVVDWEGGKVFQDFKVLNEKSGTLRTLPVKEDAGVEILVMSPDGTLRVHNSRAELNDPERKRRYDEWKKSLADTENQGKKGGADDPFKPKK
jgi:hypothetical protein